MRFLRVLVLGGLCQVAIAGMLACGGSSPPPPAVVSSTWTAPTLLSHVPADTPYLVGSLEPVSEAVRKLTMARLGDQMAPLSKLAEQQSSNQKFAPWLRAMMSVVSEMKTKNPDLWWRDLGLDPNRRFVIYGLSVWPVMRLEVAEPTRTRGVVERAIAAAGVQPIVGTLAGHAYWAIPSGNVTLIAAVLDREAVAAVVPTQALASALPLVLGTELPPQSLASTSTVHDLLGRHQMISYLFAYVDSHSLVDIVAGRRPSPLDAPLHAATGPVPPACAADLDRMAAWVPRVVLGYDRVDLSGFHAAVVFETAPGLASALKRMHASVPEVSMQQAGDPLMSFGVAANPEETVAVLRDAAAAITAHPFACPWLEEMNASNAKLAQQLAQPLPPMIGRIRGFAVVLNKATAEPLSLDGHVLLADDQASALIGMLSPFMPFLAGMPLKPDGRTIELPAQQLKIPTSSMHAAMSPDRVVIAAGDDSANVAVASLKSPTPAHSPLLMMAGDWPRLSALVARFGAQKPVTLGYLGQFGMSLDAVDSGLSFDVWGSWSQTLQQAVP